MLDLDVTDDQVHGHQEQAFFNTYYGGVCYAPLYLFCGKHLLAANLRPANVDPKEGALEELQRVMQHIRSRWPQTRILVRGDSAYSRENIMTWCESQGIDYVFGLASNERKRADDPGHSRKSLRRICTNKAACHLVSLVVLQDSGVVDSVPASGC